MKRSKAFVQALFLLVMIFTGCAQNQIDIRKPEFAVSVPEYRSGSEDSSGGVYFDFYNRSGCAVTFIETRMNVYDKKTGKNAFTGQGTIKSGCDIKIKAGEKKELCVCLDEYITVQSEEGYLIDQFYISRIDYEDGRVWKDEWGLYACGGGK